jgi:hypothetical protein
MKHSAPPRLAPHLVLVRLSWRTLDIFDVTKSRIQVMTVSHCILQQLALSQRHLGWDTISLSRQYHGVLWQRSKPVSHTILFYYLMCWCWRWTRWLARCRGSNLRNGDPTPTLLFKIPHKPPAGSLKVLHAPARRGGIRRVPQTKIYNLETREFVSNPPFSKTNLAGVIKCLTFRGNDGF